MGSTFSVVLYGEDRNKLEAASEDAFDEVRRLDSLLSNYKPESEWSRVNNDAGKMPVAVSGELYDLLTACLNYSRNSRRCIRLTLPCGPEKITQYYHRYSNLKILAGSLPLIKNTPMPK